MADASNDGGGCHMSSTSREHDIRHDSHCTQDGVAKATLRSTTQWGFGSDLSKEFLSALARVSRGFEHSLRGSQQACVGARGDAAWGERQIIAGVVAR